MRHDGARPQLCPSAAAHNVECKEIICGPSTGQLRSRVYRPIVVVRTDLRASEATMCKIHT
jgi:hypothetical protein